MIMLSLCYTKKELRTWSQISLPVATSDNEGHCNDIFCTESTLLIVFILLVDYPYNSLNMITSMSFMETFL